MPFGKTKDSSPAWQAQPAGGNSDALATTFMEVGTMYVNAEDALLSSLPDRVMPEAVEPRIQVRENMFRVSGCISPCSQVTRGKPK